MRPRVQHFVETRFSVRLRSDAAAHSLEWLERRVDLLRRFCLPSLAAQTTDDFTWLLFCDESTDGGVMAELRRHERDLPMLSVVTTSAGLPPHDAVRGLVRPDADVLVTTRLDSDDALADRHLEQVRRCAEAFHATAAPTMLVNFPRGYRLDLQTGALYRSFMPNSPFHSLLERPSASAVATVLSGNHAWLHEHYPTHQDESIRGWLQLIHGGNLHNRVSAADRPVGSGAPEGFSIAEPVSR